MKETEDSEIARNLFIICVRLVTNAANGYKYTVSGDGEHVQFFGPDNIEYVKKNTHVGLSSQVGRFNNNDDLVSRSNGPPEAFVDNPAVGTHTWTEHRNLLHRVDRPIENRTSLTKGRPLGTVFKDGEPILGDVQ